MEIRSYQACTRCVMDNQSDDTIHFDADGFCNYCSDALAVKSVIYFPGEQGRKKLELLINALKSQGHGKKYDCLIGISGGLDSSYLAYQAFRFGLKALAVHVDDGFDTEVSKRNIHKLIEATHFDYLVEKPDATQFNALIKAYILAGVPNLAVPQDNILTACIYQLARQHRIKILLSGTNFALESILQRGNSYRANDVTNIKAIHRAYGTHPIDKLPLLSDFRRFLDQKHLGIQTMKPLNLMDYNRARALYELADFCEFEYYGSKHLENTLTKFIQVYWFYHKFGVDKRRSHLSSMIVSGQMTRQQALLELEKPLYDEKEMQKELPVVLGALNLSKDEFDSAMRAPGKQHTDYKIDKFYLWFKRIFK